MDSLILKISCLFVDTIVEPASSQVGKEKCDLIIKPDSIHALKMLHFFK